MCSRTRENDKKQSGPNVLGHPVVPQWPAATSSSGARWRTVQTREGGDRGLASGAAVSACRGTDTAQAVHNSGVLTFIWTHSQTSSLNIFLLFINLWNTAVSWFYYFIVINWDCDNNDFNIHIKEDDSVIPWCPMLMKRGICRSPIVCILQHSMARPSHHI